MAFAAQGSAEVVRDALQALASDTVGVKVIAADVGPVTERDVEQAHALGAHLLAFNVRAASPAVEAAAKNLGIDVLQHRVIYRLLEEARVAGSVLCTPCLLFIPRMFAHKVASKALSVLFALWASHLECNCMSFK